MCFKIKMPKPLLLRSWSCFSSCHCIRCCSRYWRGANWWNQITRTGGSDSIFQQIPSLKLTWHLNMDGWNTCKSFLLGWPIFRGYVSFRECKSTKDPRKFVRHFTSFIFIYIIRSLHSHLYSVPKSPGFC